MMDAYTYIFEEYSQVMELIDAYVCERIGEHVWESDPQARVRPFGRPDIDDLADMTNTILERGIQSRDDCQQLLNIYLKVVLATDAKQEILYDMYDNYLQMLEGLE